MNTWYILLFVSLCSNVFAQESFDEIKLIGIESIKNDTVYRELNILKKYCLNQDKLLINKELIEYKRKKLHNRLINLSYKSNDWSFYITFKTPVNYYQENVIGVSVGHDGLIETIRFYHVKYMIRLDYSIIQKINEIIEKNIGKNVKLSLAAFSSKDKIRHYLIVKTLDNTITIIIKNSRFYNLVM